MKVATCSARGSPAWASRFAKRWSDSEPLALLQGAQDYGLIARAPVPPLIEA